MTRSGTIYDSDLPFGSKRKRSRCGPKGLRRPTERTTTRLLEARGIGTATGTPRSLSGGPGITFSFNTLGNERPQAVVTGEINAVRRCRTERRKERKSQAITGRLGLIVRLTVTERGQLGDNKESIKISGGHPPRRINFSATVPVRAPVERGKRLVALL
ncbi:hypothetical protein Trydic_g36 [Trypoxylus dichotomus]